MWTGFLAAACALSAAPAARACAVCFGDPDSDMAKSAVAGVMFLGAVVVCMLAGVASLATCWAARAQRLNQASADADRPIDPPE